MCCLSFLQPNTTGSDGVVGSSTHHPHMARHSDPRSHSVSRTPRRECVVQTLAGRPCLHTQWDETTRVYHIKLELEELLGCSFLLLVLVHDLVHVENLLRLECLGQRVLRFTVVCKQAITQLESLGSVEPHAHVPNLTLLERQWILQLGMTEGTCTGQPIGSVARSAARGGHDQTRRTLVYEGPAGTGKMSRAMSWFGEHLTHVVDCQGLDEMAQMPIRGYNPFQHVVVVFKNISWRDIYQHRSLFESNTQCHWPNPFWVHEDFAWQFNPYREFLRIAVHPILVICTSEDLWAGCPRDSRAAEFLHGNFMCQTLPIASLLPQ